MTSKLKHKLKCDLCPYETKWKVLRISKCCLSNHKKEHHEIIQFLCETCKKVFTSNQELITHGCITTLCDNEIVPFEPETNEINIETEECVEPIENNFMVQKVNQTSKKYKQLNKLHTMLKVKYLKKLKSLSTTQISLKKL